MVLLLNGLTCIKVHKLTVTVLTLADYIDAPTDGTLIEVTRRTGKIWNDSGKSLANSENQIAKFITDKTISLPR